MPTLGAPLDFAKLEARNMQAHQLGALPTAPVKGQVYFDTRDNTLYWYDGSAWVSARGGAAAVGDASTVSKGVIQLAGDLTGTAVSPQIAAGAVTDAEVAAANKDGAAGVASMRTLGTGATQAAAGNAAPIAHKTTHEPGGADALTVDAAVAVGSLRTLGAGAQQAMPGNRTLNAIPVPVGAVNMSSQRLTGLADPISAADGTNKQYVDQVAAGLDAKQSVRCATTGNVTLSNVAAIDGVTLQEGDRVLVKDQTTPAQNGIYWWTFSPPGMLQRAPDATSWAQLPGAFVFVEQGTVNADTGWVCIADAGGTIGTTSIMWTQFAGPGEYIGGAGLLKTGNVFDVGAGPGITVNADTVQVANNGITNAMIADGAIDLSTADVAGTLPLARGGTGQTTAKAARETGLLAPGYYTNLGVHGAGTTISIPIATHGLRNSRGIMVQVNDNTTGAVELPDVVIAASGDVTITYAASIGANSKTVVLVG